MMLLFLDAMVVIDTWNGGGGGGGGEATVFGVKQHEETDPNCNLSP